MTVPSNALGINSATLASPPVINIFVVSPDVNPDTTLRQLSNLGALASPVGSSGLGFGAQLARALPPPPPPPQPTVQESFSQLGDMIGVLTTMNTVLGTLLAKTQETPAPAATATTAPAAPAVAAPTPAAAAPAPAPANLTLTNKTTDATQKARLDATLAKVANDPDGSKLLAVAKAAGYTIEVGDPTQIGATDEEKDPDSVFGVTIPDQKRIIVNPNAPNFDKTVVHELVHAATENDGDSQTEEGMADVIGFRVASRIDGTTAPGTDQQIFNTKILSYPTLGKSNTVIADLAKLGITVPNLSA